MRYALAKIQTPVRGALPERRFRQRNTSAACARRWRRCREEDRHGDAVRGDGSDGRPQIISLAATKADVLMIYSVTPRACAQAIRKAWEVGWRPTLRFLSSGCANIETILKPAGLDAATGILTLASRSSRSMSPRRIRISRPMSSSSRHECPASTPTTAQANTPVSAPPLWSPC